MDWVDDKWQLVFKTLLVPVKSTRKGANGNNVIVTHSAADTCEAIREVKYVLSLLSFLIYFHEAPILDFHEDKASTFSLHPEYIHCLLDFLIGFEFLKLFLILEIFVSCSTSPYSGTQEVRHLFQEFIVLHTGHNRSWHQHLWWCRIYWADALHFPHIRIGIEVGNGKCPRSG